LKVTAQQKDAIVHFYQFNSFRPLWVGSQGLNDRVRRILALLANAEQEGLKSSDYLPASLGALVEHASGAERNNAFLARLDIGLTAMALRYAEHIHSGRIIPKRLSGYYDIEPPALILDQTLHQLWQRAEPDLYLSSLAPSHPSYSVLKASLAAFRKESVERERQPIPAGKRVKPGGQDVRVPLVRARLVELGFLRADDARTPMAEPAADGLDRRNPEAMLDKRLSTALKAFQAANGIEQTGSIDKATVEDLNSRPERDDAEKLVLNMERLRWLPRELGERHILVNQASFELRLINRGDVTWSTKVIVGTPDTQTAVFSDEMETVVINPYWGVPQSIIRYEMMPRLARDRRYLDREGYEVVNERGRVVSSRSVNWWAYRGDIPFGVRQPPGDGNALGRVKFLFPNSHDIYMHDTPTKQLFAEPVRAFSHGCVRVESPREFAGQVLGWEPGRIDAAIATGETQKVPLPKTIPVHLNYFTAWPDLSGTIVFHADIYNRDTRLDKALNTIALASN
ncbi:MAG: L,D-transpeptidase family protein, partial [Pseudomonadota bacterium]|nr:L,D-transpeptidase family protein [Pseudomonadota bacterium]